MKATYWLASACLFAAVAGCRDNTLAVPNTNNPNITNVFATGAGIEAAIAAGYQTNHNAIVNQNDLPSLMTMDREQYSQLNNFSMGPRGGIPVAALQNYRGGSTLNSNAGPLARGARLEVNAVNALDLLTKSLGTTGPSSPLTITTYVNAAVDSAEDMRDRAFAFFIIGIDQARIAMQFDSVGIVHPGMPSDSIPPLCQAVNTTGPAYCASSAMADAIRMLDTAEVLANKKWGCTTPGICTGFGSAAVTPQSLAIPATWLGNNGNAMSLGTPASQFPALIRSYRAYFRANQARTAAQRADTSQGGIVNWSRVIQDAESGIGADFVVAVSKTVGYTNGYTTQGGGVVDPTWGQVEPMFYGMADTSGAYVAYLANAPTARGLFLIQTPDKRFPAGATRGAQQAASPYGGRKGLTYAAYPYINNRTQQDGTGDAWGVSMYDNYRSAAIPQNGNVGIFPDLMLVQLNLLAAEGHLRLGSCAAVCLGEINASRTKAGLPAIGAGVTVTTAPTNTPPAGAARVLDAKGGTAGCVPQVPYASLNNGTACGDIWEAMKYEYRMETEYVGYAEWYWYNRGFNDLIDGTPYEWPVPNEEMDARYGAGSIHFYVLGGSPAGTAGTSSNTGNTYGNFGFKF